MKAPWPLLALVALGCQMPVFYYPPPPKIGTYRSHALARLRRPRTLVLPFRHTDKEASRQVTEAFVLELQKAQVVEVVSPYGEEAALLRGVEPWRDGALEVRALTTLRKRLGVDAVVIGTVTDYRPYEPPIIGVRAQVVSVKTGKVLWGAETCLDARDAGVRSLMRHYYGERLAEPERSYGWHILLTSPRHFAQFVAYELVATLAPPEPPPRLLGLTMADREGLHDGNPQPRRPGNQSASARPAPRAGQDPGNPPREQ